MASISAMMGSLQALADDVVLLIRQEFALAKVEVRENLAAMQSGLIAIAVGVVILIFAVMVLIAALILGLSELMHPGWAALLVGGLLAGAAVACLLVGRSKLSSASLIPERTLRSVRAEAEKLKETF